MWQYFTMLALKTVANLIFFSNLLSVQVNLDGKNMQPGLWRVQLGLQLSHPSPPPPPHTHTLVPNFKSFFSFFFPNQVFKSSLEHEFKVFVQF
jgi:hypothetical protein